MTQSPTKLSSILTALAVAIALFAAAPATADDIGSPNLVQTARAALYAGDIDRGIALSEKALELALTPAQEHLAVNNLCVGYAVKGASAKAIDFCDRAVGADRGTWDIYTARSRVDFVKRAFEQAAAQ